MTDRFHREAARKRISPVAVIFIVIGALFVISVVAIFVLPGGDQQKILEARIEKNLKEARELRKAFQYDQAVAAMKSAIRGAEELGRRSRVSEFKATLREIEREGETFKRARRGFEAFEKAFKEGAREDHQLLTEGRRLQGDMGVLAWPWKKKLQGYVDELDDRIAKRKNLEFTKRRIDINTQRKLDGPEAEWGGAVSDWKAYIANEKVSKDDRKSGEEELERVENRAYEKFTALKNAAKRRKAEGLELLRKNRPRFDSTRCAAEYDKLISEVEKR
jgi:hypothetical protein